MSIIAEAVKATIELTREIDGRIYNSNTGTYSPATVESLVQANTAVSTVVGAILDLLPFPVTANIMGLFNLDVTRSEMDVVMAEILTAIRSYTKAVTI